MLGERGFSYGFGVFDFSHDEVKRAGRHLAYRFFSLHSSRCIRLFVLKEITHDNNNNNNNNKNGHLLGHHLDIAWEPPTGMHAPPSSSIVNSRGLGANPSEGT